MTDRPAFTDQSALADPVDETHVFAPKFSADGLIPAIATDAGDGRILMLAYMNREALAKTIETGDAWYWSRSRGALWRKGATSGHLQKVVEIRTDCDQDAIELVVEQTGAACHTGRRACFYRRVMQDGTLTFESGGET
ncbi:MAG: phosphoribosyl-AMP cyclohydrolase [Pseudomonadota bacterium]